MRGTLLSLCLGVAAVVGATVLANTADAQTLWFDPAIGQCDIGQTCMTDGDCLTMEAPSCIRVGDGGDPLRCRPTLPFFECCDAGDMCSEGDARFVLGVEGPDCICVHPAISECFGTAASPPIFPCLTDPETGRPAATIAEGDCDFDLCPNAIDPDPCDPLLACGPPDAGPRDGGPLDGGPRDGGGLDLGTRDGGDSFDARPDDGDADVGDEDATVCPTVVLPEEDCGIDGHGNGCDDDANGEIDDGCEDTDAGDEPEDAATPPRDSGSRRDMGSSTDDDAGEEPDEDAGEEPKMDAATGDPSTDGRVFRGSGGCGTCSVADGERNAALPWLALGICGLTVVIRSRVRRRRKPLS